MQRHWNTFVKWFDANLSKIMFFILRLTAVIAIIAIFSIRFEWLVGFRPIDTIAALIMTWASIIVLVVTLFPNVFDRVKRVKIKDFEIELQDVIRKVATNEFITPPDLSGEFVFTPKGGFDQLRRTIQDASSQPDLPVLLVVNLRNDRSIHIPMLVTYLFLMQLFNIAVIVLFISQANRPHALSDITRSSVRGAVSGDNALEVFFTHYPYLIEIFGLGIDQAHNQLFNNFDPQIGPDFQFRIQETIRNEIRRLRENATTMNDEESAYLSLARVQKWFGEKLNSKSIDNTLTDRDVKIIEKALAEGDEFLSVFRANQLESIVDVSELATKIAKKAVKSQE